jgi:Na+-driven multidrug efflux pump
MWNSLGVNGITLLLSLFAIVFLTASQLELIIYLGFINIGVRILSFCFLLTMARIFTNEVRLFWRFSKKDLKKQGMIFLKITLPSLLEPLSYQFYQMVLIYIIAIISIESLAIRSYVISIIGLLEVSSLSLAKGNQIILGHLFGQREFSSVKKQLKRGITYALSIAIFLSITTLIWKDSLISFFSKNQDVIKIGSNLLVLSTILIFLRAWTYQISNGLKAAGDVRYCVFVMNFCAWGMTIPGAFFCVHFLGLGLNSIWFMLILDELIRGLLLWQRWRNEKWRLSILTNP